jgi:hypothetical protein
MHIKYWEKPRGGLIFDMHSEGMSFESRSVPAFPPGFI